MRSLDMNSIESSKFEASSMPHLNHLTRWLQRLMDDPSDPAEQEEVFRLPSQLGWQRSLALALALFAYWFLLRVGVEHVSRLELPLIVAGVLLARRILSVASSVQLINQLPIRPQDMARCQLRLALRLATFDLLAVVAALWFAYGPWLDGDGRYLNPRSLALAAGMLFLATLGTLALGLPTDLRRGGLPMHRRRYAVGQALILLSIHWKMGNPEPSVASNAPLDGIALAALAFLVCTTLNRQLKASYGSYKPIQWRLKEPLTPYFIVLFFVPFGSSLAGLLVGFLAILLLLKPQLKRLWHGRTSWTTAMIRGLDASIVFCLIGAEIALWIDLLTVAQAMGVQLALIALWWCLQHLVERPRQVELDKKKGLASTPSSPAEPSSLQTALKLPKVELKRQVVHRSTHLLRTAYRGFLALPSPSANKVALATWVGLGVLVFSLMFERSLVGSTLPTLAATVICVVVFSVRHTLTQPPLIGTLPVENQELGHSLRITASCIALALLTSIGAFLLLRLHLQGLDIAAWLSTTALPYLVTYGVFVLAVWVLSLAVALPIAPSTRQVSTIWVITAAIQIAVAVQCVQQTEELTQLTPGYRLVVNGWLCTILLVVAGFGWRTQSRALRPGTGVQPWHHIGQLTKGARIKRGWWLLPFVALFLLPPFPRTEGYEPSAVLAILLTLVIYRLPSSGELQLESKILKAVSLLAVGVLWVLQNDFLLMHNQHVERLSALLSVLTTWVAVSLAIEGYRLLRRVQRSSENAGIRTYSTPGPSIDHGLSETPVDIATDLVDLE